MNSDMYHAAAAFLCSLFTKTPPPEPVISPIKMEGFYSQILKEQAKAFDELAVVQARRSVGLLTPGLAGYGYTSRVYSADSPAYFDYIAVPTAAAKPTLTAWNCKNCGAPMKSNECEYCDTRYL